MRDRDLRLWHPWLRIERVLRDLRSQHWDARAWHLARLGLRDAVIEREKIRRVGWFN